MTERTAAFQQSEKNIRTVFETSYMNQGLLTVDGKIIYVNATSLASINSSFEDVVTGRLTKSQARAHVKCFLPGSVQ